jgi:hypothetical protein
MSALPDHLSCSGNTDGDDTNTIGDDDDGDDENGDNDRIAVHGRQRRRPNSMHSQ